MRRRRSNLLTEDAVAFKIFEELQSAIGLASVPRICRGFSSPFLRPFVHSTILFSRTISSILPRRACMIQNGKKVKIEYTLFVGGEVFDTSKGGEPLEYHHGSGQIIPGLEHALEGLKPGDEKKVHVGPEDAYGPIHPQAILQVPREQIQDAVVEVGMVLSARNAEGQAMQGVVREVTESTVTVDFNHPLAGKELYFEITIIDVL